MQTNIARASDYDQAWAAGNTRRWRYVPIIAVTRFDNPQDAPAVSESDA
jgi:hypothetical protein